MSESSFFPKRPPRRIRQVEPLKQTSRDVGRPMMEGMTPLSESLLGYQHPQIDAIREAAQATYRAADTPFGIPGSRGYSELMEEELTPVVAEIQEQLRGEGVFVDCGYGDGYPAVQYARKLGAKDIVGIEIAAKSIGEIGEYRDEQTGENERTLLIREDITVVLAQMQTNSVDVLYYSALDVLKGDLSLFFQEADRVLKPGGYLIDDGDSRLYTRDEWQQLADQFEEKGSTFATVVFRKKV